ncbi:SPOR domain-containing protein [Cognatishimia sp. SS12]|uniref:SPOR domain-containing protein n=1 Tax=Cognatishimia sp. SS12 TaxID=2979465 RepID=UPI00232FC532|nr:SPOR domain-containing protein [Cognatishimia sp. SS12]MDC0737347.1 SPOR domain-containing protein [Cognatishimia sp. SS12]
MAELPMTDSRNADPSARGSLSTMANWAGAVVSLSLIVGAGVWGYKLLVRDVSGVPVVRAIEGPMREQPKDPGGSQAAHQGLSVNGVAAVGTAAAPADRLVLAPPPIKLRQEDAPSGSLRSAKLPEAAVPAKPGTNAAIVAPKPLNSISIDESVTEAVAAAQSEEIAAPDAVKQPKVVAGGLGRSLRPKARPTNLREVTQTAAAAAPTEAAALPLDINPDGLPAGTRLVQLGAFASAEIARAEWDKLQGRFGDYLGDKRRVVQEASSGGRTFYRLRAHGFADLSDARRICAALKAENADCIPVVTR